MMALFAMPIDTDRGRARRARCRRLRGKIPAVQDRPLSHPGRGRSTGQAGR